MPAKPGSVNPSAGLGLGRHKFGHLTDGMDAINRGDHLLLRNAYGDRVPARALSGVQVGGRDAYIWVCADDQWEEMRTSPDHQVGTAWPIDAIERPVESRQP